MQTDLDTLPLFDNLTPEERTEIGALLQPASFKAGEKLFSEGKPEDNFYVLVSGVVEVTKEVFPGRAQRLAVMDAPTVVGEMGLFAEPKAAATVTASEPVEARRLSREAFLERLDAGSVAAHKLAYEMGRTLAERMANTDEAIARIVARLDETDRDRDFEVFQDKLMREWSF